MTYLIRCDKCGTEIERCNSGYITLEVSKFNYETEVRHYCPSCAFDLLDSLGIELKKYEERTICCG